MKILRQLNKILFVIAMGISLRCFAAEEELQCTRTYDKFPEIISEFKKAIGGKNLWEHPWSAKLNFQGISGTVTGEFSHGNDILMSLVDIPKSFADEAKKRGVPSGMIQAMENSLRKPTPAALCMKKGSNELYLNYPILSVTVAVTPDASGQAPQVALTNKTVQNVR